jgi:hypothetical protein
MTYTISKEIRIHNDQDGWEYVFTTDDYGTVNVQDSNGPTFQTIHIPRDCIQHFIDALEELK